MKQLLFLLLFPCLALAQYPNNGNQKITLGEQTTADGLVFRGVANDTNIITPFSDTSAYIILDTIDSKFYHYNRTTTYWALAGGGGGSTLDTATMLLPYYRAGRNGIIQAANVPTLNQNTTGSAATLTTARNIRTNLASAYGANFDGSANITPGVMGVLGAGNGGTGASNFGSPNRIPFVSSSGSLTTDTFFAYNGTTQRLGVGVPNPTEKLHVDGNGLFTGSMSLGTPLTGANGGTGLTTFGAVGNIPFASSTTALKTNNTFWLLEFGGKAYLTLDGGNFRMRNQAQFQFFNLTNSYAWAAVVQGTTWQFQNDAGTNVMQMRGAEERVGIGFANETSIDQKFAVNGNVKITGLANAANPVNVQVDVNGVLVRTSSIDIKEDVQSLPYGLKEVMLLQPSKFSYIDKYKYGEGYDIGFIAQDVNNVIPEAVGTGIESDIFMDSVKLIPVLTKAIQEQQALIKALEQRILILENK